MAVPKRSRKYKTFCTICGKLRLVTPIGVTDHTEIAQILADYVCSDCVGVI